MNEKFKIIGGVRKIMSSRFTKNCKNYAKSIIVLYFYIALFTICNCAFNSLIVYAIVQNSNLTSEIKVIFDDTHAQKVGNADWVIDGGYSEFADTLKNNGFTVDCVSRVSNNGLITADILLGYSVLVLPEPNNPYTSFEQEAIINFIKNGGGVFFIADHGGADRNFNGWDSVKIFNSFCSELGFSFCGNTFYEAPLQGFYNRKHPILYKVKHIGAWAATTITDNKINKTITEIVTSKNLNKPYVISGSYGKGRFVAIGDSSPFDDGIGSANSKAKLHDSFRSFLYSHPQFAYNVICWLANIKPQKEILSLKVPLAKDAKESERNINILIDAAHGNSIADKMQAFQNHMEKLGYKVYYNLAEFNSKLLKKFLCIIIPNPSFSLKEKEIKAVSEWFFKGGVLLLHGEWDSTKFEGRSSLNKLLNAIGSVIRINSDQIWDEKNNTNKPWGVISKVSDNFKNRFENINRVITWGTASLISRDYKPLKQMPNLEFILVSYASAYNKDGDGKNDAIIYERGTEIPIMALERLVNSLLIVCGCTNFSDYQYPTSRINEALSNVSKAPVEHQTDKFYDQLIKYLLEFKHFNVQ